MAWQQENFSGKLNEKIRDFVWSNLSSQRIVAQTADLYTSKILAAIVAMLGGKMEEGLTTNPAEEDLITDATEEDKLT